MYRFYIEDESGRQVQKEFAGTESKSGNGSHAPQGNGGLRSQKQFVGKAENITVGEMLDLWVEEELKARQLEQRDGHGVSRRTVKNIKKYPDRQAAG